MKSAEKWNRCGAISRKILGRDAVMQGQTQHGWFFHLFGYRAWNSCGLGMLDDDIEK